MAKMKELIQDVIEALIQTRMDYETVADMFGMSPTEVYDIAREYGDIDNL